MPQTAAPAPVAPVYSVERSIDERVGNETFPAIGERGLDDQRDSYSDRARTVIARSDYRLGQSGDIAGLSRDTGTAAETSGRHDARSWAERPAHTMPSYRRHGTARWMGQSWAGRKTVTQEPFDPDRLTGAHASLPLPSYLYVTNRSNGRTVLIRLNDRPATGLPQQDETVVLVSRRVADLLEFSREGTASVALQYAGPAALVSRGWHEESFLQRQPWYGRGEAGSRATDPVAIDGVSHRRMAVDTQNR